MVFCPTPTPSKFRQKGALIPFGSSWSCTRGLGETSFDSRSYDFELFQIFVTNNLCPLVLSYLNVRVTFNFFNFFNFFLLFQWSGISYLTLNRGLDRRLKWAMFFCPTPTPSKFGLKGAPIPFRSSWSCTRGLGETSFDSRSFDFELFQTSVTNNLCPLVLSYLDVRVTFHFFNFFNFFLLFQWTGKHYLTLIRGFKIQFESSAGDQITDCSRAHVVWVTPQWS